MLNYPLVASVQQGSFVSTLNLVSLGIPYSSEGITGISAVNLTVGRSEQLDASYLVVPSNDDSEEGTIRAAGHNLTFSFMDGSKSNVHSGLQ